MIFRRGLAVVAVLTLTGCASTPATFSGNTYGRSDHAPTDASQVKFYRDFPPQGYDRIGEIEAEARSYQEKPLTKYDLTIDPQTESKDTFEAKLRARAAAMGGDAVVLVNDGPSAFTNPKVETKVVEDEEGKKTEIRTEEKGGVGYGRKIFGYVIKFR